MFDASFESEGLPHSELVVVLVTYRGGLAERLRLSADSMGPRGVDLQVHGGLKQAFAQLPPTQKAILVVDDTVDAAALSGLPQACSRRYPNLRLVLVADHLDPMFQRSARKVGYWRCFTLNEAMRADFLQELKSLPIDLDSAPSTKSSEFASRFGASDTSFVVANERGRIRYANPAFYRAVGLLACDLRGVNLSSFFPELSPSSLEGHFLDKDRLLELRRASGNQQMVRATFLPEQEGIVLSF